MKPWTPERRARHSAIMKARERDAEFQKKIAASREANLAKGQEWGLERKARQSAKQVAVSATPEWKMKQALGFRKAIAQRDRRKRANAAPDWCPPFLADDYIKLRRHLGAARAKDEILALMEKDTKMWPFKKRNPLADIQKVETLNLQPGDLLLVTMPTNYPMSLMNQARDMLREYLGDIPHKVILAQAGTEFRIARQAATEGSPRPEAQPLLG